MAITGTTAVHKAGGWRGGVERFAAPALGAAVPLLVFGRTALAVAMGLAILGLLAALPWRRLLGGVNAAMKTPLSGAVWLTFAIWLLSAAGSFMIERSLPVWLRMAALLLVGVALCLILRERRDLLALALKGLVAGAVGAGIVAVLSLTVASDAFVWLRGHGDERDIADLHGMVEQDAKALLWHEVPAEPDYAALPEDRVTAMVRSYETFTRLGWKPYMFDPAMQRWAHRVTLPALALWGEHDRFVTPDYGRNYARALPDAKFATVPGAGHFPLIEQPEAAVRSIVEFTGG